MISIILYGRNDDHGYNLHRRAALSLNCLAEVLTDEDDEIVFVDYKAMGNVKDEACLKGAAIYARSLGAKS